MCHCTSNGVFFFGKYTQVRELMVMLLVVKSSCLYFVAEGESVGG